MDPSEIEELATILTSNSRFNGECLEWTGKLALGYGSFPFKKKVWAAHRAAYIVAYKSIPDGKIICHKCNNKKCININHLYAGTYKENARDIINSPEYPSIKSKIQHTRIKNIDIRNKQLTNEINSNDFSGYSNISQFARLLGLSRNTIKLYINIGVINAIKFGTNTNSTVRIPNSEILRLAEVNMKDIIEKTVQERLKEKEGAT